jgi:2-polyprenyl-6-methoxyphenol hydroxylase-like FAD-dependent oxidoreductase
MSDRTHGRHAVVIGGSMGGLLAARVLADHYERVTVLERDRLPDGPDARKGTPQARHIHVLLTAGRRVLERLFPTLIPDLIAAGAEDYDAAADMEWLSPAGLAVRFRSDLRLLGATRDLIEWGVRTRIAADARIAVRTGVDVAGLRLDPAGARVVGLNLEDRTGPEKAAEALDADLVVDSGGRGSRTPQWLEAFGFPRPPETVVNGFLGYSSRLVRPAADRKVDWKTFYIQCAPPRRCRGGVIATVEGGRWIVTLVGGGKDYPPTDEEGFRAFARSLPDPRFAEAYEASEPLTPIVGTKSTENRVRHYERLTQRPEGLLVIGDAACSFNPVYGQGMSAAAVGADVLDRCLTKFPPGHTDGLAARFQKRLARANTRPWLLATGEDYRYAEVEGPARGRLAGLTHRYLDRVIALAARSPRVRRRFMEVVHLIRSPASLFAPGLLARAALTRVRAPSRPLTLTEAK